MTTAAQRLDVHSWDSLMEERGVNGEESELFCIASAFWNDPVERVREYLKHNKPSIEDMTEAALEAARLQNVLTVNELRNAGARLESALMKAAFQTDVATVRTLIDAGVNIHCRHTRTGASVLLHALSGNGSNMKECVRALLTPSTEAQNVVESKFHGDIGDVIMRFLPVADPNQKGRTTLYCEDPMYTAHDVAPTKDILDMLGKAKKDQKDQLDVERTFEVLLESKPDNDIGSLTVINQYPNDKFMTLNGFISSIVSVKLRNNCTLPPGVYIMDLEPSQSACEGAKELIHALMCVKTPGKGDLQVFTLVKGWWTQVRIESTDKAFNIKKVMTFRSVLNREACGDKSVADAIDEDMQRYFEWHDTTDCKCDPSSEDLENALHDVITGGGAEQGEEDTAAGAN